jgi:hypothetical protein
MSNPIRGQLRNWHTHKKAVVGQVFSDEKEIYDNGDAITLLNIKEQQEGATYFLFITNTGDVWKADKDDQIRSI